MIGLIDPFLFLDRKDADIEQDFLNVIRACREYNIKIPPLQEYWPFLWRELGGSLEKKLSEPARSTLRELRKLAEDSDVHIARLPDAAVTAWRRGFDFLFNRTELGSDWKERMALSTIRAVLDANQGGRKVVIFCRQVSGRNCQVVGSGNNALVVNTRWMLHVQPTGVGACRVLCVHHPRNLKEPWTSRFDWRLPAASDGARYPFCFPRQWWKGSIVATDTVESKPAWIDAHGNGWARPNIPNGKGYHWDVFINNKATQDAIGVKQINVVEFGAPTKEGSTGCLHHVPKKKKSVVKDVGWSC